MDALDVKVSIFENYNSPDNPQEVSLLSFLKSAKYKKEVEAIRATADKEERNRLKARLPAITPSGLFSRREEAALVKHSGLIQIDIDAQDNPHISNFPEVKEQLRKLPEVAYLGLSVSGRGFWGLIPLAFPEKHQEQFEALKMDFAKWGLVLDEKPKNVAALRGYSFDDEAYFNPQARPYAKVWQPKPERYQGQYNSAQGDEAEKVEACLAAIEARRVDIAPNYSDWFAVGCALADEFQEGGRGYFHRASQFYPKYSSTETDKQFTHCLKSRGKGYTVGTFYQLCQDNGITYKESFQKVLRIKQMPPSPARKATAQTGSLPAVEQKAEIRPQEEGQAPAAPTACQGEETPTAGPELSQDEKRRAVWKKWARYYIVKDRMGKAAQIQKATLQWLILTNMY